MYSQKDSLQLGDRYAEDQIYAAITFNQFYDKPANIKGSGFSYGFSIGFMKDFILNKTGSVAIALGTGYGYDSFNHGYTISNVGGDAIFTIDGTLPSNRMLVHNIEFPLELRWRTSTATEYKFWRIYAGVKINYNFSNTFRFYNGTTTDNYRNVSRFNKWQYGLTLSVGRGLGNVQMFYGLTPMLANATSGTPVIATKILKFSMMFYIL